MKFVQKKNEELHQLVDDSRKKNYIPILENLYNLDPSLNSNLMSKEEKDKLHYELLNDEQKKILEKHNVNEDMIKDLINKLRKKRNHVNSSIFYKNFFWDKDKMIYFKIKDALKAIQEVNQKTHIIERSIVNERIKSRDSLPCNTNPFKRGRQSLEFVIF